MDVLLCNFSTQRIYNDFYKKNLHYVMCTISDLFDIPTPSTVGYFYKFPVKKNTDLFPFITEGQTFMNTYIKVVKQCY